MDLIQVVSGGYLWTPYWT